tara:strand:+ start:209 stop:700 length:492 start_codon:yes stop_codon:yes gene_type:complete
MKHFEKYGKYKWDFVKGEEYQYDCYFRFDEQMMANLLNCKVEDADAYLAVELRTVDYDEDYTSSGTSTGKMINPTYWLEMWGYDDCATYSANNLNHVKSVANKYIQKLIDLVDAKNYNCVTFNEVCLKMYNDEIERKEKERKARQKKDLDRRIKNFMSFAQVR